MNNRFAKKDPSKLAQYSASDVVATYNLFEKYIKTFIFSVSNIIPLNPDEILRQEKDILCETLLMVSKVVTFSVNMIIYIYIYIQVLIIILLFIFRLVRTIPTLLYRNRAYAK